MDYSLQKSVGDSLYEYVYKLLEKKNIPKNAFKKIEKKCNLILFGGAVRDYLFFKNSLDIRDLDFVLSGIKDITCITKILQQYFSGFEIGYNNFGGIKISINQFAIDIWRLEETRAFQKDLLEAKVNNITKSVFLNIDAYAYDMNERKYINDCNLNAFPNIIDITLREESSLDLNLLRALVYSGKYNIPISDTLKDLLLIKIKNPLEIKKLKEIQLRHFKKEILDFENLEKEVLK